MVLYDRREFGWPVVLFCAVMIAIIGVFEWQVGLVVVTVIDTALLALVAVMFSTLRVRVFGDAANAAARVMVSVTTAGSEVEPAPPSSASEFVAGSTGAGTARLQWSFLLGFPRGSVSVSDIDSVEATKTTLVDGIGIHMTGRGWVWNVHNGNAVWVHRKSRGPVIIGTSDPEGLCAAIEQARSSCL